MAKGWWYDRYNYDRGDYSYSKGSGARGWMSKLGSWWDEPSYGSKGSTAESAFQELLDQLQNSANLLGSDSDGGRVRVAWSDGNSVNMAGEDRTIYLSPNGVLDSSNEVSDEKLDGMTGKVYLASMLRETVHPVSFQKAMMFRKSKCVGGKAVKLWEAVETGIARSRLLEDWAGFGPYVVQEAMQSSATKDEVQTFLDLSAMSPTVDAAITAVAWNLLNPSDNVVPPGVYDECMKAAAEILAEEVESDRRFDLCVKVAKMIEQLLPPPTGGGGGDSKGEGDESEGGESKGEGPSDGGKKSKKSKKKEEGGSPKVCDGSMLGETVKNEVDSSLSNQEAGDDSDAEGSKIDVKVEGQEEMNQDGKDFSFVVEETSDWHEEQYRRIVGEYASAIRAVKSSLMFRNTDTRMVSYGHRRGDIDENSLYKVRMGDERVMCVQDAASEKKIAVCVLVDESGSMGGGNDDMARDVAIVMAEGLRGVSGITVNIYGHSAETEGANGFCRGVVVYEYLSPRNRNPASCMNIEGRVENHDGFAIQHVANQFLRDNADADRKIMFVISDGEPCGSRYGGRPAENHVRKVCESCDKRGLEVYGIGVMDAFDEKTAKRLYGEGRCVVLSDVKSSLGVMTRFLRQIASKMTR